MHGAAERSGLIEGTCVLNGSDLVPIPDLELSPVDHWETDRDGSGQRTLFDADGSGSVSLPPGGGRIGPYRLVAELAKGGMACVYLALRDASLDPAEASGPRGSGFYAVKLVHSHLAGDPVFCTMFADEAELAARIRHENVCATVEYEMSPDHAYIAMEYLVGKSLSDVYRAVANQPASPEDRLARMHRVCAMIAHASRGLHAAHELRGDDGELLEVVHRDVTPSNIFLTYEGVAKIVDFGVAKAHHQRHRTQTGVVKGKPSYVAPELLHARPADRRSDLWSIGVVLWELLAERRLFRRPLDIATYRAVLEDEIPPPSRYAPHIPAELDAIVLRTLQRDPALRTPSARVLQEELMALSGGEVAAVTAPMLGEWLESLFPTGHDEARHIVAVATDLASRADSNVPPPRASQLPGPPSSGHLAAPAIPSEYRTSSPLLPPPTPVTPPTRSVFVTTVSDARATSLPDAPPGSMGARLRALIASPPIAAALGVLVGVVITLLLLARVHHGASRVIAQPLSPVPPRTDANADAAESARGAALAAGELRVVEVREGEGGELILRVLPHRTTRSAEPVPVPVTVPVPVPVTEEGAAEDSSAPAATER